MSGSDEAVPGAARCPFLAQLEEMPRLTEARYADGLGALYQGTDPMEVAQRLFDQDVSTPAASGISALFTTWGQFLDHDLSLTPEAHDEIMENPAFAHGVGRSEFLEGTGEDDARQFGNAISWQIDGSMIYGSNDGRVADVRAHEGGKLKMIDDPSSTFGLLPQATPETVMAGDTEGEDAVFLAGDVRANENPNLLTLHTLFAREHNYWADKLADAHPDWTDDQLFEGARQIVEFEIQKITYDEWLPLLVGNAVPNAEAMEFDADVDGQVALEFSTAAFRFGHTLVASQLERVNEDGSEASGGHQSLMDAFFNPDVVREQGIDAYLRGMAGQSAEELDTKVIDDLNFFLQTPEGVSGFSLPALNLMRSADHGMGSYLDVRAQLLGDVDPDAVDPQDFSILTSDTALQAELAAVYPTVHDVDLWVGGLAEDKLAGTMMGPLFTHIVSDQFIRTASGDETFGDLDEALGADILAEVRDTSLQDVILRNSHVDHIQDDPFLMNIRDLTDAVAPTGTWKNDLFDLVAQNLQSGVATEDGDDTVTITGGTKIGGDVALGAGDDDLTMTSGQVSGTIKGGDGADNIVVGGTARVAALRGEGGDDDLTVTDMARVTRVDGGDGNDRIAIGGKAEIGKVMGGDGNDRIEIGPDARAWKVDAGAGDDRVDLNGPGVSMAVGGNGHDRLHLDGGVERVAYDAPGSSDGIVHWDDGSVTRFTGFEVVTCFTPGTLIVTAAGKLPIESLKIGARVMTLDHGLQKVRWIGRTRVAAEGRLAPVRIDTGALANTRPLSVSPQHRMVLSSGLAEMMFGTPSVLAPAIALTDREGVSQTCGGMVDYIHILFDRHEIVLAEGIPSESFHPGVMALSSLEKEARRELLHLFPHLWTDGYGEDARPALRGREARLLATLMD